MIKSMTNLNKKFKRSGRFMCKKALRAYFRTGVHITRIARWSYSAKQFSHIEMFESYFLGATVHQYENRTAKFATKRNYQNESNQTTW